MTSRPLRPWTAPYAERPVHAVVDVPGSKSMTNRALVLAALAESPSRIYRPLLARDTRLMMAALAAIGVGLVEVDDAVTVTPRPFVGPAEIACGLAGTVMRFVPPVAALAAGEVSFDGDLRARRRPMGAILDALRALGVAVHTDADSLPFTLTGRGTVPGGVVTLDASSSSQFVSALLLAGPRYEQGVDVRHDGKPIPSQPHIDMTVAMLRERGVVVDDDEPNRWRVSPGPVCPVDVEVEPDLSNAAPFLAAAVVTGGSVSVPGWPRSTTQAGDALRSIFARMGAETDLADAALTVTGTGTIAGVDLDLHEVGELAPVVAAVSAFADSPSHLRGIAHLRGHETDRLAALATELRRLGGDVAETNDGLRIAPRPLSGSTFRTYDDHRMAHAGAVLGLRISDLLLDDVGATSKTHPDFAGAWSAMLR